jgi:hypothetical protein
MTSSHSLLISPEWPNGSPTPTLTTGGSSTDVAARNLRGTRLCGPGTYRSRSAGGQWPTPPSTGAFETAQNWGDVGHICTVKPLHEDAMVAIVPCSSTPCSSLPFSFAISWGYIAAAGSRTADPPKRPSFIKVAGDIYVRATLIVP